MYYFLYVLVIKLLNCVYKNSRQNIVSVHMIIIHTKLIIHSPHRWFRKQTFQKEEFEDTKR
jgi:hypothetical protein